MRYYFNLLVNLVLLFTTPLLLACSQADPITVNMPVLLKDDLQNKLPTYDDLFGFIEEMESGNLEKYTFNELKRSVQFLVSFARTGMLPNREKENKGLEYDIQELLFDFNAHSFLNLQNQDYIVPVALYEEKLTKNSLLKHCQRIRNFCKNHKKTLTIGSAVFTAIAALSYLFRTTTLGKSITILNELKHTKPINSPHSCEKTQDTSMRKIILDYIVSVFEEIGEINLLSNQYVSNQFNSVEESPKYAIAKSNRQIFDGISDVTSVLYNLMNEDMVKKDLFLPESLASTVSFFKNNYSRADL